VGGTARCLPLDAIYGWDDLDVMAGRTCHVAPDRESLLRRWDVLKCLPTRTQEDDEDLHDLLHVLPRLVAKGRP
jgi:hypothetical protein